MYFSELRTYMYVCIIYDPIVHYDTNCMTSYLTYVLDTLSLLPKDKDYARYALEVTMELKSHAQTTSKFYVHVDD